jgi:hypothetical protein
MDNVVAMAGLDQNAALPEAVKQPMSGTLNARKVMGLQPRRAPFSWPPNKGQDKKARNNE